MSMCLICSFSGIVLYAWFDGCDPVASGQITSFDQVIPHFARVRMSKIPGLGGFLISGIFSASLSTVSAMLNSLAAVAIADYIKPIYRKLGHELQDSRALFYGKALGIANGLLCVAIAFLASSLGNLMQTAIAIGGAIGGPVLGLFSLGIFVEIANEIGAVIGTLFSLFFTAWMIFGQPKPPIHDLPLTIDKCLNSTLLNTVTYTQKLFNAR